MSKIKRRNFLSGASLLGLGAVASNRSTAVAQDASLPLDSPSQDDQTPSRLEFNSDGSFKVIQFNDTQDDHLTDKRTIEFMEHVLDAEKPGFVLINGDVISAGPTTPKQVYQAINNVVLPMESRGIPWAVTFGNHDEDSAEEGGTGVRHQHMTQFVRSYRHNRNAPASSGGYGASNTHLALYDAATARFSFWLLDSGRYHPETIGGQDAADLPAYDYIHPEQIAWYAQQSDALAAATGSQVEGLMFFHIPTYEHRDMWFGGRLKNGLLDHAKAVEKHGIKGEKNEDCYVGAFNSGIYAAAQARGDIRGIYCGHDHINTYMGNYYGIELGYGPGTGFGAYGLRDGTLAQHSLRGARVFEFSANAESVYTGTRVIFAKDIGIDMTPAKQPLKEPAALPEYVKLPEIDDASGSPSEPEENGSSQSSWGLSSLSSSSS